MSNNAPDYKNNLVFAPKSADNLNKQGRQSDVLIKVIDKENRQLKKLLKEYRKQLSEIKDAYMDLTTQDEYGSYYIEEAKLFIEIVVKTIKYIDDFELKQDEVIKC